MKPGIHPGIEDVTYRALDGMTQSGLRRFVTGEKERETRAMILGSAFHAVLQDPVYAARHFAKMETDPDLRTKEGKQDMAVIAESTGKIPLRATEYYTIKDLVQSIKEHPVASKILAAPGESEVVVIADLCGVRCKGLLDKVAERSDGQRVIVDWKTTGCESEQKFKDSIYRFGYDVQGAFYINLYAAIMNEYLPFMWVCVSKQTYETWVTKLTPEQYTSGKRWYEDVLTLYKRYNDVQT